MEECGHLQALEPGFRSRRGDWDPTIFATGPRSTPTCLGPGRYDWAFRRPDLRRTEAPQYHADRRPLPFRRAGLDRQLPEPGFSRRCSANMPARSPNAIPGSAVHPGQRDVHLRHLLGAVRLVERTAARRQGASSPRSSTSSRPTCWRCRRSCSGAPDAIFIQSESSRILPRRKSGGDGRPRSLTRCGSCRSI